MRGLSDTYPEATVGGRAPIFAGVPGLSFQQFEINKVFLDDTRLVSSDYWCQQCRQNDLQP
jgi:hypothetical protein